MTEDTENKVTVTIYGDEYPVTGATDPAYISKIADYVDKRMKDTAKGARSLAKDKIAILAAMSIASELYEKKETADSISGKFDSRIDNIIERIDSVLR